MSRAQVETSWPVGSTGAVIEFKPEGGEWHRLGIARKPVTYWQIYTEKTVTIRARPYPRGKWRETAWDPKGALGDKLDAGSITFPAVTAVPDGPAITVKTDVPLGESREEWQVEIRSSADGADAKDAVYVDTVDAGDEVTLHALPEQTTQTIHTRGVRNGDNRLTAWVETDVEVPEPEDDHPDDHTTDFASGTIAKLNGSSGPAVLEVNSGDLRFASLFAGDASGYAGDATDQYAGDAWEFWSPGTYTTDTFELDANADIMLQVAPELTSTTRASIYAGDAHWPAGGARLQEDGTAVDTRRFYNALQNGVDETPIVFDAKVATSATASPTFTDSDFVDLVPGKALRNVKAYAVRFAIYTYFGKQLTIDKLYVRRWIYCRSRPWCSHSSALEKLYSNELTSATNEVQITGLVLDQFSEILLEVVWKQANAGSAKLAIWPNDDSTAGNYDPAVSGAQVGSSFVLQNEWERAMIRLRPVSGEERQFFIESNPRWIAAGAPSDSEGFTAATWQNTADEITSLVVTTTDNAANRLASGTTICMWGRRR